MSQIVEESFAALPVDIQISIWDYATYTDLGRLCITCHAINDLIGLGTESKVNRVVWRGVYTRLRRDIPKFLESHRFWKWRSFVMAPPPMSRVGGGTGGGGGIGAGATGLGGRAIFPMRSPPTASLSSGDPRDDALRLRLREGDPNCMYYEVRSLVQKYWPESKAWDTTESHPRIEPYSPLVSVACPEHTKLHRRDGLLKTVLVGDSGVGKTSIINSYVFGHFSTTYVATIFDYQRQPVTIAATPANGRSPAREKHRVGLLLADTAGQSDYDRLRSISYPEVDCVVMCFSIDSRASFESLRSRWIPELLYHCGHIPIVICGTKGDLRAPTLKKPRRRRSVERPISLRRKSTRSRSKRRRRRKSPAVARTSKSVSRTASPQLRPMPASFPQWHAMTSTKISHKLSTGSNSDTLRVPTQSSSRVNTRPPPVLLRAHHSAPTPTTTGRHSSATEKPAVAKQRSVGHSSSSSPKSPPRFAAKKSLTVPKSKAPPGRRANMLARARSQLFRRYRKKPPPKKAPASLSKSSSRPTPGSKVQPLPSAKQRSPTNASLTQDIASSNKSTSPSTKETTVKQETSGEMKSPRDEHEVNPASRDQPPTGYTHSSSTIPRPKPVATHTLPTDKPPSRVATLSTAHRDSYSQSIVAVSPPSVKSARDLERERAAASNAAAQVKRLQEVKNSSSSQLHSSSACLSGRIQRVNDEPCNAKHANSRSLDIRTSNGGLVPKQGVTSQSVEAKRSSASDSVKSEITPSFLLKRLQKPARSTHHLQPLARGSHATVGSDGTTKSTSTVGTQTLSKEASRVDGSALMRNSEQSESVFAGVKPQDSHRKENPSECKSDESAAPPSLKFRNSVGLESIPSAFGRSDSAASRHIKSVSSGSHDLRNDDLKLNDSSKELKRDMSKSDNARLGKVSSLSVRKDDSQTIPFQRLSSSKFNSSSTNFGNTAQREGKVYHNEEDVKVAKGDDEKYEMRSGDLKMEHIKIDRASISNFDDQDIDDISVSNFDDQEEDEEDELPILSHHRQASLISHQEITRHLQALRDANFPIVAYVECSALQGDVDHVFGAVVDQIYRNEMIKKTTRSAAGSGVPASVRALTPRRRKRASRSRDSDKSCVLQ